MRFGNVKERREEDSGYSGTEEQGILWCRTSLRGPQATISYGCSIITLTSTKTRAHPRPSSSQYYQGNPSRHRQTMHFTWVDPTLRNLQDDEQAYSLFGTDCR